MIFAPVLYSLSVFATDVAANIPALAGKSKSEVATMLGEPSNSHRNHDFADLLIALQITVRLDDLVQA